MLFRSLVPIFSAERLTIVSVQVVVLPPQLTLVEPTFPVVAPLELTVTVFPFSAVNVRRGVVSVVGETIDTLEIEVVLSTRNVVVPKTLRVLVVADVVASEIEMVASPLPAPTV